MAPCVPLIKKAIPTTDLLLKRQKKTKKQKNKKNKNSQTQNRKWQGHREENYSVAFESQTFTKDKNVWFMST